MERPARASNCVGTVRYTSSAPGSPGQDTWGGPRRSRLEGDGDHAGISPPLPLDNRTKRYFVNRLHMVCRMQLACALYSKPPNRPVASTSRPSAPSVVRVSRSKHFICRRQTRLVGHPHVVTMANRRNGSRLQAAMRRPENDRFPARLA